MLFLIGDEVSHEGVAELIKEVNGVSSEAWVLVLNRSLQGGREGLVKDLVGCSMQNHNVLEVIQVINGIWGPIIGFQLWYFELRWDLLIHDIPSKRGIGAKVEVII